MVHKIRGLHCDDPTSVMELVETEAQEEEEVGDGWRSVCRGCNREDRNTGCRWS